jgi:transcriptional repressor NrdR
MKCPFCGHMEDKVIESRAGGVGDVVRRRRECEACERRFTTYERIEEILPTVVKKDGRREPYDRQKLVRGLRIACNKRPVSMDKIEAVADAIEREVQESGIREVTSSELGERMMQHLRALDEVAYVRFASVYKSFRDIDEFLTELGKLVKAKGP